MAGAPEGTPTLAVGGHPAGARLQSAALRHSRVPRATYDHILSFCGRSCEASGQALWGLTHLILGCLGGLQLVLRCCCSLTFL